MVVLASRDIHSLALAATEPFTPLSADLGALVGYAQGSSEAPMGALESLPQLGPLCAFLRQNVSRRSGDFELRKFRASVLPRFRD